MYRANTNIIGYLQRKAFFSKTPSRSPTPSPNSRFHSRPNQEMTPPKQTMQKYRSGAQETTVNHFSASAANMSIHQLKTRNVKVQVTPKRTARVQSRVGESTKGDTNSLKQNSMFKSSRLEVKMCVQDLSSRVSAQLRKLEGAITELTVTLQSEFHRKLQGLRQQILTTVDKIFTEAQSNLNHMISKDSEKQLKDMVKTKHSLNITAGHLNDLRKQMEEGWRKVAGTLLGEAFDEKIEEQLQQSVTLRERLQPSIQARESKEQSVWEDLTSSVRLLMRRRCLDGRHTGRG